MFPSKKYAPFTPDFILNIADDGKSDMWGYMLWQPLLRKQKRSKLSSFK